MKYKWYHGVAFFIVINLLATGFFQIDVSHYREINLPIWAFPGWVFMIAWTINNSFVIWGNLIALNSPKSRARTIHLWVQFFLWLNYAVYNYLTFGLRNTDMYFWAALPLLIITFISIETGRKVNKRIVKSYITQLPWQVIAVTLGAYIMYLN